MNATKGKALFANLIAPGFGHLALKKWGRGVLYIVLAGITIAWLVIAFIVCIIGAYFRTMNGGNPDFNFWHLAVPFFAISAVWIFSYIDLLFLCKTESTENTE